MEGCGKKESIEIKKFRLVFLHSEAQEVQANDRHYQEIRPRKRNHTSRDKFNSPKLIDKPLTQAEPREREKNVSEKGSPTLPGCQNIYAQTVLLSRLFLVARYEEPFSFVRCPEEKNRCCCCREERKKRKIIPLYALCPPPIRQDLANNHPVANMIPPSPPPHMKRKYCIFSSQAKSSFEQLFALPKPPPLAKTF